MENKIKTRALNWILFVLGILTVVYLSVSLVRNYAWTIAGDGFVALYFLIPITVILAGSCFLLSIIYSLILLFSRKEKKVIHNLIKIHIVLASLWLIFLQGIGLVMEAQWVKHRAEGFKGVFFDLESKRGVILPRADWRKSKRKIFYISHDNNRDRHGTLWSIDVDGKRQEILNVCILFGWLPNGKDMFAVANNALYLLKGPDATRVKLFDLVYYKRELYILNKESIEVSPQGDKFTYAERDKDTNGDGVINWRDNDSFYIFDVTTKTKQEIDYGKNAKRFEECRWNRSGELIYFIYVRTYSPNDVRFHLCSYDLNNKNIVEIGSKQFGEKKNLFNEYVGKENLFETQKYYTYNLWFNETVRW